MTSAARAALDRAERAAAARQWDAAIAAYRDALAIAPGMANTWYNLARTLRLAGQAEAALAAYDEALARGIDGVEEVHLNRAVIFADLLGDPKRAEEALGAALRADPHYRPALLNLGNLHEDMGRAEAARACYERLLADAPDDADALARWAQVEGSGDGATVDRLRAALGRADTPGRAVLGFALAHRLDRAGEHEAAMAALHDANAASRAAAGGVRYDPIAATRLVDRLIAWFDGRGAMGTGRGPAPLFICGPFRSGSTLLEQMLAAHGAFVAGGERDFLPKVAPRLPPYVPGTIGTDGYDRLADAYRAAVPGGTPAGATLTDKRPDNLLHLGLALSAFPTARALVTQRHPLDNILSLYFLHLDPGMAYALDLDSAAHWAVQLRRLGAHWQAVFPDRVRAVDYDALVADPEATLTPLLAFLGKEWTPAMLDFPALGNAVKTASAWSVRQPLNRQASGRWKAYRTALDPARRILAEAGIET